MMTNLVDILEGFVRYGEKVAMVYRTGVRRRTLSYSALHDLALRMNALLAARGVGPGERVLLWGSNSPWWGVAFWGIVARGGVAVPVDYMSGPERAEAIARHTDASLVIRGSDRREGTGLLPSLILEELEYLLNGIEPLSPALSPSAEGIAQLIYTSGTTGTPKGVILTHGNLMANLGQVNSHIRIVTPEFRFLSLLPLSHMFEQMGGFFTPLVNGSSIVYLRTLKPSAIMEALAEEDVRAVVIVPRLLQLLKGAIEVEVDARGGGAVFRFLLENSRRLPKRCRRLLFYPVTRRIGRRLSLFVSGGAPLPPEIFRFWDLLGYTVVEGYGLTECSPVLTAHIPGRESPGSVGVPLPGVEIRVDGGEVLARGDNVFPGYYRNEEATATAFTRDGWFRTGDLGEMDGEGLLRIRGRSKELIVTGAGVNVYPDGIEEVLNRCPGVREGCVIGLDRGEGEEVHAVLLLDESGRSAEEIVAEANSRIDPLSRITGFTVWPEADFPKTTTMKVRKYLVKERIAGTRGGKAPPPAADRLTSLISRVTGTPVAGIGEGSLLAGELGLTSIGRLELVNLLEQEFRLDLEESQIGADTTVAHLRGMIERREKAPIKERLRFWTNSPPVRGIRMVADLILHYPLYRCFVRMDTTGLEHLGGETPIFFAANHTSYLDHPSVMFAMPRRLRYRTATAAWAEFFFVNFRNLPQRVWKRFCFEYGSFALNLFPLPGSDGFRRTLSFMGRLADNGISILVFPEGERTVTGEMLPFRLGMGIMVKELGIPVVPLHISGLDYVFPRGARWPRRGRVRVAFGEPLCFTLESPEEIVARVEGEVRRLALECGRSGVAGKP